MVQNCPWYMLDAELNGSDQVRGASIIDVDSIGEGGGQPKVNHSTVSEKGFVTRHFGHLFSFLHKSGS